MGKIDTALNASAMCSPLWSKLILAAEWEITGCSRFNLQQQMVLAQLPPCASKAQKA